MGVLYCNQIKYSIIITIFIMALCLYKSAAYQKVVGVGLTLLYWTSSESWTLYLAIIGAIAKHIQILIESNDTL